MSTRKKLLQITHVLLETFATNCYVFQSQVAAHFHFHPTDMLILHVLRRHGPLTAGMLAEHIHLTSGAATTAVDRLVAMGYVVRKPQQADRRKILVQLSPAKTRELKGLYKAIDDDLAQLLRQYNDAELATIVSFLQGVTEI